MSVIFEYCEEGSLHSYVKVTVIGEDQNDDKVKVTEAITPQDLLKAAADLIDQSPYYKDFFDKRLLG
jgi:citrate lyase alpha subunit